MIEEQGNAIEKGIKSAGSKKTYNTPRSLIDDKDGTLLTERVEV